MDRGCLFTCLFLQLFDLVVAENSISCNRVANTPLPGGWTQCGHSAEKFLLFTLVLCFLFLKVGTAVFISFAKP